MKTFFKHLQRGWHFTWLVFFGIMLWGNVTAQEAQIQINNGLGVGETSVIKFSINNDLLRSANNNLLRSAQEILWTDENGHLYHMDHLGKVEKIFYSGNLRSYFQEEDIISVLPEQVLARDKLSANFQPVYFWKDLTGHYYQVDSNKIFWMSLDGRLWKFSDSREWEGNDNTVYRLNTNNMRVSRSNDNGQTWTYTENNRWQGPTNQEYQMDRNGEIQVRLLDARNQGTMSTLPKTEMQLRFEDRTANWYNTNTNNWSIDNWYDTNRWVRAPSNQWPGNNGNYLRIQQDSLMESSVGAYFYPSRKDWWVNNQGTYYKFDSSLNLWQSKDGKSWKKSSPPYWREGNYEYRLDTNNQVLRRKLR